jgi:hydrogenase small subunit
VIWLHFQDCTGCTETLLRTSAPDVAHLILDVISLDYHETLMAASGAQAEAALRSAIADNAGKYVLVVEGSIPTKDDGVYMELGGKPAIQVVREVAARRRRSSRSAPARRGAECLRRPESHRRRWA